MLKALTFFGCLLTVFVAGVAQADSEGANSIVCTQNYTDYDQSPVVDVEMSKVIVKLDGAGNAESVEFHKTKDQEMDELNLKFDRSNSTLTHTIEKNNIEGIDEDTKQPIYQWGIENVEVIKAIAKDGSGFRLAINDHRYGGIESGSTNFLIKSGQETELPHGGDMMIICKGPLRVK